MNESVAVLGGSGHARVVISTLRAAGVPILGVYDDNSDARGTKVLGVEVLGPLEQAVTDGATRAVIAIGNNLVRKRLADSPALAEMEFATVVHPHSFVDPGVRLGAGTVVFAGAVVQPGTVLGRHTIVNTGATIDHDNEIADFCQVCPGAHLAGSVRLEEGVFVATGASLVPGVRVGSWTIVGAGSVVVNDLPANTVAFGVPARPQRPN